MGTSSKLTIAVANSVKMKASQPLCSFWQSPFLVAFHIKVGESTVMAEWFVMLSYTLQHLPHIPVRIAGDPLTVERLAH